MFLVTEGFTDFLEAVGVVEGVLLHRFFEPLAVLFTHLLKFALRSAVMI